MDMSANTLPLSGTRLEVANIVQRIATDEPKQMFKRYTTVQLSGDLAKWRLGGSLTAQHKIYRRDMA